MRVFVAIEPEAGNFDLLSRNVDGLAVETVNAAVSSAPGRARTVDPGHGHWGYRTTDAAEDIADAVPHVTINSIYHSHAAKTFPFLVKANIEGAESDLFADTRVGGAHTAANHRTARLAHVERQNLAIVSAMHREA